MPDVPERQARREAFEPRRRPADVLSDDARQYTEAVPAMQAQAAAAPVPERR